MSTVKDFKNVDDGDSWEKLKKKVEADNGSQWLTRLTEIVLEGFVKRMVNESTTKKKMINKKKDIKNDPVSGTHGLLQEEKEDYLTRTQKKQKTENNSKEHKQLSRTQKKQKTENNSKKHKQKTGNKNNKKQSKKKGSLELAALGLEPPPEMPQAFKNCIENLGGIEIKLVIQKFIQITDLKQSQNRLSMPVKQVRNTFLTEAEEKIVENVKDIEVVFIEPCLQISKMHFTKWQLGGTKAYIFKTEWHGMATRNTDSLKPKSVVQVWSFRVQPESKLGFALIKVREGEDGYMI